VSARPITIGAIDTTITHLQRPAETHAATLCGRQLQYAQGRLCTVKSPHQALAHHPSAANCEACIRIVREAEEKRRDIVRRQRSMPPAPGPSLGPSLGPRQEQRQERRQPAKARKRARQ